MKTKQERIDESVKRIEILRNETILRYTDEIEFDADLSIYDVMMKHFAKGDLDDVFLTDVTNEMSDDEKKALFELAREFQGLCFYKANYEYWLDSLENTPVADYSLIASSIFDNYAYLLYLAKDGGREVLEQIEAFRNDEELKHLPLIEVLRNTFVDDRVLSAVLFDMADKNGEYSIFTDEQKGILLTYPEGTLYSYGDGEIRITSPLLLGVHMYDELGGEIIEQNDTQEFVLQLGEFFRNSDIDFYEEILNLSDQYRDYFRRKHIVLNNEMMKVVYDRDGEDIQEAWSIGDSFLGGTFDTPYSPTMK